MSLSLSVAVSLCRCLYLSLPLSLSLRCLSLSSNSSLSSLCSLLLVSILRDREIQKQRELVTETEADLLVADDIKSFLFQVVEPSLGLRVEGFKFRFKGLGFRV